MTGVDRRSSATGRASDVAHRDQSQNPLRGRLLSPIDGTRRLPSLTERLKSLFPRWRARLLDCRRSLASIPEGLAEMSGLATGRGGSFGC
jgi:hypothetical protein